jgi:Uncharacterised nucleotidyltransferase
VSDEESFDTLVEALKLAVAALREAEVPFLLGGSLAAWARGAPKPHKDLDLMVRPADAERALAVLERAGMQPERPPEEWLFKAWCGEVLIDLIFSPAGLSLTDEVFARAQMLQVMAISVPVMAIEDVLVTKLNALDEHALNYTPLLGIARALREQIDWSQLEARAGSTPYSQAFFTLVREMGIAPGPTAAPGPAGAGAGRVRVIAGS